jgi:nucleotide-binding universal stress UspA family protein
MKRFKHIVVTTDLSPESYSAVSYAAHLAKGQGARLTVLHVPHALSLVYTHFSPPVDMMNIDEQIHDASLEALEEWVRRHLRRFDKVELALEEGVPHEAICDFAERAGASLIVMATHGRRGFGHFMLGSVTERVIRRAPCPVLVVNPEAMDEGETRKVASRPPRKVARRKSTTRKTATGKTTRKR